MGVDQILPLATGLLAAGLCYSAHLLLNICKYMHPLLTIARREALLSLGLALLYMLAWYGCAYAVPADITWHGWPLWFLLSCLFNPLLFVGLCALMIKRYFKVVALDAEPVAEALAAALTESQPPSAGPRANTALKRKAQAKLVASLSSPSHQ